jgi:hypothetical protein
MKKSDLMKVPKTLLSQRPPAQRVAWILPPTAVKDRGRAVPRSLKTTRFGKPNQAAFFCDCGSGLLPNRNFASA